MSNKSNIFSVLPQDHSDDEDTQGAQHSRKDKKQTNKRDTGKGEEKSTPAPKTQDAGQKAGKDDHKKKKQVPEPGQHPLDRHSGTGQPAFDRKNFKKGGHGKGNVGSSTKEGEEETKEEATEEEQAQEEAKPEGITLEEYYAQSSQSGQQSQIDQAKLKSVQDELTKELLSKKATLYVKNKGAEEDKPTRKTAKTNVDHHAALNSEHAELLNFRTGFIEFKERKEGDKKEKPAPKKEEKTEEAPATEEKAEGAEPEPETEKGGDDKGNRGGRGGYRGGNRGGYKGKGGNRGGNYKGAQPKINVEDDSAFPKLG